VSFDKMTCWMASCDDCGPDWWQNDIALDGPPHFHSKPAAYRELRDTYGWELTRRINGSMQMLCANCADKAECAARGCDWRPADVDHGSQQQARWDAEHPAPLELCARCGRVRRDFAPPPGHPESVTAISDEHEAILTVLASDLTDIPETLARLEASEES
jgi:hypothetical protein